MRERESNKERERNPHWLPEVLNNVPIQHTQAHFAQLPEIVKVTHIFCGPQRKLTQTQGVFFFFFWLAVI